MVSVLERYPSFDPTLPDCGFQLLTSACSSAAFASIMTDTFAYHPPTISPTRYNAAAPSGPAPHAQNHSPLFSHSRPSSSAGPYGLAALQEHPQDTEEDAGHDRPRLVGFEQLTGEPQTAGFGALADTHRNGTTSNYGQLDSARATPTFNNPFPRPVSPGSSSSAQFSAHAPQLTAVPPVSMMGASHHAFFNPHPGVNARNTRPMTAPSGPGYFTNSAGYSAAPSAFYAPQHTSILHDPVPQSLNMQYGLDLGGLGHAPFRPNTAGDLAQPVDPRASFSSIDGGSPSSSTPFFYAPPVTTTGTIGPGQLGLTSQVRTPTSAFYPEPANSSATPPNVSTAQRPTTADSAVGPVTSTASRRRSSSGSGKPYNFVPQPGTVTKRPRRRFDEIERLYNCDYPGCTKSYGTLNHLNSHKTMQKHGPRSTPAQFKEMRKAWRERKKAEAAEAAKIRAIEPSSPSSLPTTLNPLGGSNDITPVLPFPERIRPSTSAGEYQFTTPAPFMAPPAIGGPSAFHPAPPASLANAHYAETNYANPFGCQLHPAFNDPYSTRPVTAPSHFFPSPFGQPLAAAVSAGPPLPSPHSFQSQTFNLPMSSPGAFGGHDRRFSLPAPTLPNAFPSPEVKMPQPVLGYNPSPLLNGSNGPNALGFGINMGNKVPVTNASHGGAAEDGTFGAIKEDIEGENRSSILDKN
ncbi:uncharacterized protein JCM15063_001314 [Sporobolomyces koalae]|uniref:uncharacterized protein n=1 Tax=Sporobolomyces koalae TaxID=500713 RepID=UPI0031796791